MHQEDRESPARLYPNRPLGQAQILVDLGGDGGEKTDLSAKFPKRTGEMRQRLSKWRKSVGARIPTDQKVKV